MTNTGEQASVLMRCLRTTEPLGCVDVIIYISFSDSCPMMARCRWQEEIPKEQDGRPLRTELSLRSAAAMSFRVSLHEMHVHTGIAR